MIRLALLPDVHALAILNALAVVPRRLLAAPLSPGQLLTLVTATFLHAGWLHLGSNLLYLLVFGPTVQARLGWRGFLALYLASGAVAAVAFSLVHPASSAPLVGASGAIAGVLGAHLILEPRARITTLVPVLVVIEVASLPAAFVIALWFALQVVSTLAPVVPGATAPTVAWTAHIGGFLAGLALATPSALKRAIAQHGSKNRTTSRRAQGRRT
jgi:membrane associated rhomboid family serine protease